MATTKTLTPTNQAITLAAFTEKPDNRTNVTNDDRLADAVNTLNSNINNVGSGSYITTAQIPSGTFTTLATLTIEETGFYMIEADASFAAGTGNRILLVDTTDTTDNTPCKKCASLAQIKMIQSISRLTRIQGLLLV